MWKAIAVAALVSASVLGTTPAEAKICRDSRGRTFPCHKVMAPRINLKAKHPIKVLRCRGHVGKFNKC